jgi:hypothetical protein
MLPPAHETPKTKQLKEKLETLHIDQLLPLRAQDFEILGRYIQLYNTIELNLRRTVEVLAKQQLIDPKFANRFGSLRFSALITEIKRCISILEADPEATGDAIKKLDEIERKRAFRNMIAHWSAQRIPNEDAFVFITKNDADAIKTKGEKLGLEAPVAALCLHLTCEI